MDDFKTAESENPRRFVCTGCSLLCDDVSLLIDRDKSPSFERVCKRGLRWLAQPSPDGLPRVAGTDVSLEVAVAEATKMLGAARMPGIFGLADQSCETQQRAVELARRINAAIDWTNGPGQAAWHDALQHTGRVSCSVGELAELADFVIVWSANPLESHPRLLESYRGRVVAVDSRQTATTAAAHQFLAWNREQQHDAIHAFRARLRERKKIRSESHVRDSHLKISDSKGADPPSADELFDQLIAARYVVLVVNGDFAKQLGNVGVTALSRFVDTLNSVTHCRLLILSDESNERGAEETMTLLAGAPYGLLLREGKPLFRGREATFESLARSESIDVAVWIGARPPDDEFFATACFTICIGTASESADISIPASRWGIESGGSGFRLDGTPVNASVLCDSTMPSATDVLAKLLDSAAARWLDTAER